MTLPPHPPRLAPARPLVACALLLFPGAAVAAQDPVGRQAPPAAGAGATPAPGAPAEPNPPAADPAAPALRVLTIDEAVREAIARNPNLEDAGTAVRRAQAVVAEARAFQRPRLDGSAQFMLQGPIPSFTITLPSPNPGQPPQRQDVQFGRTFTRSFSVGASYDVDPFGRLRANRRAAQAGANAARGAFLAAQNELVFTVQNLYLAALRARELVSVSNEAVGAAREQLRVADAQFRAGTSPEFDVLRARVQVANLRQNVVEAEAQFRRTTVALAELLSLDPASRLELVPVALPPEPDAVAGDVARRILEDRAPEAGAIGTVPTNLERALSEAFTRRPEVYRTEWNRRAAEARVASQRTGNLPSLTLGANGYFNPDQAGFAVEPLTWSLVANINIPIWDAGLTRARVEQARADVASARAQERAARNAIVEEVRRGLIDLEEARERRRAASANTAQAREALRIARVRYQAGIAQNVEVTDAEVALLQARTNEVNAAYDYLAALANLNRGLGRYGAESLEITPSPVSG